MSCVNRHSRGRAAERLARRCSFESISALSLTHIPEKHRWRWVESSGGLIYLPEWLSMSWSLRRSDKGKSNQLSRSEGLCLSYSLLGLEYFKANSCFGGFSVVFFFLKGVSNLSYVLPPLLGFMIQFVFYYMVLAGSPSLKFKPKQPDGGTDIKILIWWILKKITLVINQGLSTGSFHHLNGPSNQTTNLIGEEVGA